MAVIPELTSFTSGTAIVSADMNSNFTSVRGAFNDTAVLSDTAKTISVKHTYSAAVPLDFSNAAWANGTIPYIAAAGLTALAVGAEGKLMRYGGSNAPTWTTATFPNTAVAGDLLHASATNVWSSLAKGSANTVLVSDGTDPSWASLVNANISASAAIVASKIAAGTFAAGTYSFSGSTISAATSITSTSFVGALTGNASTATLATSITAVANNSTNETVYPTFVDGATGTQGIETDTGLYYNPSSGTLTSTVFVGALTGNASGSSASCTGNSVTATLSATVTVADESSDTTCFPAFFTAATGSLAAKTDTSRLTYNAGTGAFASTSFVGALTGALTGTVGASSATTGAFTTLSASSTLVVSGAGPHAIGGASFGNFRFQSRGNYTSTGDGTFVAGFKVTSTITGAAGDTASLSGFYIDTTLVTQTATESIGVVSQMHLIEPNISDNLTGNITLATTVYIKSAPTEGQTNAALYVAAGATILGGTLAVNSTFVMESSGVAHGLTSAVITQDTDHYTTFQKASSSAGGLAMQVTREDGSGNPFDLYVLGGEASTTDTTTSSALTNIRMAEHNGSNALINAPTNQNIFMIAGRVSGAWKTHFLLKGDDGELHVANTTLASLDEENDIELIRAMQYEASGGKGMNPKPWDTKDYGVPEFSHEKLMAVGVLGEKDADGNCLMRVQPRFAMNEGAIWQNHVAIEQAGHILMSHEARLNAVESDRLLGSARIETNEEKIKRLKARIEKLEALAA
jgi:hypothetical protein